MLRARCGVEDLLELAVKLSFKSLYGTSGRVLPCRATIFEVFLLSVCFGTLGSALDCFKFESSFVKLEFGTEGRALECFTEFKGFTE